MGSEKMLTGILEPLRGLYDYIIVDTCPSLGTLTINALTAADEVIIAVNPQLLAMMGLQDFIRTVKKVRSRLNDRLQIAGTLFTVSLFTCFPAHDPAASQVLHSCSPDWNPASVRHCVSSLMCTMRYAYASHGFP